MHIKRDADFGVKSKTRTSLYSISGKKLDSNFYVKFQIGILTFDVNLVILQVPA